MDLTWFLILVGTVFYAWTRFRNRKLYNLASAIPGSFGFPIIGSLPHLALYKLDFQLLMNGFTRKYGSTFRIWLGDELNIFLSSPKDLEVIMSSNKIIDKGHVYNSLHSWLGLGLLTSTGSKWHGRRKLLTPTFHFRILDGFVEVFDRNNNLFIENLRNNVGKGPFNIQKHISLLTLDVICESAMGTSVHAQKDSDSDYVKSIGEACAVQRMRVFFPWLRSEEILGLFPVGKRYKKALGVIHGFTDKVIAQRRKIIDEELKDVVNDKSDEDIGVKQRKAFLDHLICMSLHGEDLNDKDISDEVNTFMFEGHDTTAVSLGFTCHLLSMNQDVQERAAQEVLEVLGDRPVNLEDLNQLKFIERVIKESLRLYPSVPLFFRYAKEDIKLPSGYTIPAGAEVALNVFMAHRDPTLFPEPLMFDPDRFLSDNMQGRNPFAYAPFSAGPRNCIGQKFAMLEMKTTLARLLRTYKLLPPSNDYTLDLEDEVVLRSTAGILVKLEHRRL